MKISKDTFTILNSFSAINPSILLMPGNTIMTTVTGSAKDFYAIATVEEDFPVECCIFDLKKFKKCSSLFTEPDFGFGENFVTISDGKNSFRYLYCKKDIIDAADYSKKFALPDVMVEFDLPYEDISKSIAAAEIIGLEDLIFRGENGKIIMTAVDGENMKSNNFSIVVAENVDTPTFTAKYTIEKLRWMVAADYRVSINSKVITKFVSDKVTYYHGGEVKVGE